MSTIVEIAERAGVSVEGVLRVVNREPVSQAIADRVMAVLDELGPPHDDVVNTLKILGAPHVLPPERLSDDDAEQAEEVASASEPIAEPPSRIGSELEPGERTDMYDALRVQVEPVAGHVHKIGTAVNELGRSVEELKAEVTGERAERLNDLALLVDMISTGWRTVDQRLGRVELMLERLSGSRGPARR